MKNTMALRKKTVSLVDKRTWDQIGPKLNTARHVKWDCVRFAYKKSGRQLKNRIKGADRIQIRPRKVLAKLGVCLYSHHIFITKVEGDPDYLQEENKAQLTFIYRMRPEPFIRKRVKTFEILLMLFVQTLQHDK